MESKVDTTVDLCLDPLTNIFNELSERHGGSVVDVRMQQVDLGEDVPNEWEVEDGGECRCSI